VQRFLRTAATCSAGALLAVLVAGASLARGDVGDIALLGDQANLMGGAVTASTQGGPSMWYNPSRLSFGGVQTVAFAVSGAGFAMRRYKIPDFISTPQSSSGASSNEVLALPRATTLVVAGRERLYWGIGLFIPTRQDVALQTGQRGVQGAQDAFNALALRTRRNSFHVVGAVSWKLSERVQIGGSIGFVTYAFFGSSQESSTAYDESTGSASAVFMRAAQRDNRGYGLRPNVGLSWRLAERWYLGLSAAAPTALFYARVRDVQSQTSAAMDPSGITFKGHFKDTRGGTWDAPEAGVARVGLAYLSERLLLELDGELTGGAHSTDFEVDEPPAGNLRAGVLLGLMRKVRVGSGFFTDLAPPRKEFSQLGDTRLRGLGGTLGLNFFSRVPGHAPHAGDQKGAYSITIATRYARYEGDIVGVRVDGAGRPEDFVLTPTHGVIHELALQVGANGAW
jgi:hypothetical protein